MLTLPVRSFQTIRKILFCIIINFYNRLFFILKMGKKQLLGRCLVKDRFGKRVRSGGSLLHTTELPDGQDWNRINFQSITEQTNLDDFLATAELAGTEFQAEKLKVDFVPKACLAGMLTEAEKIQIREAQATHSKFLRIPRRPHWSILTSPEELLEAERSSFLEWRRDLSRLQEVEGIILTPYERNLEFWRQLWRVIERSDVVVQIVDARNPLLFRCEDLERYVKEVSPQKENLLLVNKSDYLTEDQRCMWAEYFRDSGIMAVFFSAISEEELEKIQENEENVNDESENEESNDYSKHEGSVVSREEVSRESDFEQCRQDFENLSADTKAKVSNEIPSNLIDASLSNKNSNLSVKDVRGFITTGRLHTRSELIEVFASFQKGKNVSDKFVTIGLVGYPNVGKSSTINSLMMEKKTSVSATPGKTKHFQTLFLSDNIVLCDCPGLVFPGFVATKAEMIISGILPVDQMRDEVPPINLVASHIPRWVFHDIYGILLPHPLEGEDPNRPPTSEELLNAYGFMRGFMTGRGLPDNPRSARYILKDYLNGKLLYSHAPPVVPQDNYHKFIPTKIRKLFLESQSTPAMLASRPIGITTTSSLDRKFFSTASYQAHIKGKVMLGKKASSVNASDEGKPWKKHNNKNKKEKLRRKYAELDM